MRLHPQPGVRGAIACGALLIATIPLDIANAQSNAEPETATLDAAVELSGLIPVLKAISLPTLFPRLSPQSLEFERTFRCVTQSDGLAYRSILRKHFARTLTPEELRTALSFFNTPSWQSFSAYRLQQTNYQLKQAPAPEITFDATTQKLVEDFVASTVGSKFMLSSVVRSAGVGLQIFDAHGSTIRRCQSP